MNSSLVRYRRQVAGFSLFVVTAFSLLALWIAFAAAVRSGEEELARDAQRLRRELSILFEAQVGLLVGLRNGNNGELQALQRLLPPYVAFLARCTPDGEILSVLRGPGIEGAKLPWKLLFPQWNLTSLLWESDRSMLTFAISRGEERLLAGFLPEQLLATLDPGFSEHCFGVLAGGGGETFVAWNGRELFPAGGLVPKSFGSRNGTVRESVGTLSVQATAWPLPHGLRLVTGLWMDRVYALALKQGVLVGGAFLLVALALLLPVTRAFRKVSVEFERMAVSLATLQESVRLAPDPLRALDVVQREWQLPGAGMVFDETRKLLEAFRGLIEEIGSQAEELAALYQETTAMQSELEDVNRDLKGALEQLEELALFSQTAVEARSTKEAATQLLSSFTAFGGARCGGMVLLRDEKPTLVAYEGDPEGKEELLQYLKNADGKALVRPSGENTPRGPGANGFDGDGRRWYVFPISYLGADIGGLFLAEEGSRGAVLGKVQNVIALFVPHVGGILRAHLLVDEVRRSYHYLALRLQGLTATYHDETGEHLQRIRALSLFLGERMGLDEELLEDLAMYSMLHDIGKMKVPHEILSKPARLDEEEFREVRRHTLYGVELLGESRWLDMARDICLYHHEKWDGSGYPEGLAGEEIPMVARIVGFVDVYDALRSRRCYKEPFSHETACRIITEGDDRVRPTDFDPRIMAVFRAHHAQFDKIYEAYSRLS